MRKKCGLLVIIAAMLFTGCTAKTGDGFVDEVMQKSISSEAGDEEAEAGTYNIEETRSEKPSDESQETDEVQADFVDTSPMAPDGDDFNDEALYMDKVRIEDFSYLAGKGLTYEMHVELQARLSRYMDYYMPSSDDKIWDAEVLTYMQCAVTPVLYKFYIYIEEIDATIECRIYRDSSVEFPYRFSCPSIDGGENEIVE